MSSIFTKIINREIPAYIVWEDENFLAFLDINPLKEGHTLVISKKEIDYIFDLEDEYLKKMTIFSKRVARGIEKVVECKRVGVAVVGLEVPHCHIHLIPISKIEDMNFANGTVKLTKEKFLEIARKINAAII
ncbi:MAG: HIT family protein [Cytophagales bacterium]|jgi:histidine triad (HIT) family protein|nr:HIT family protein [Cytophagales bacterium]